MSKYEDFGEEEFLSGVVKILKHEKLCYRCKYLHLDNQTCDAFPDGIPIVYLTGEKEHTKPSKKYNQKNDIVWESDNGVWVKRQQKIDQNTETKVIECGTIQKKAIRIYEKLKKEGWIADIRSGDEFPQKFTVYASRKKKK